MLMLIQSINAVIQGSSDLNTSYVNVNPLILSHSYISIILFSSHSINISILFYQMILFFL